MKVTQNANGEISIIVSKGERITTRELSAAMRPYIARQAVEENIASLIQGWKGIPSEPAELLKLAETLASTAQYLRHMSKANK